MNSVAHFLLKRTSILRNNLKNGVKHLCSQQNVESSTKTDKKSFKFNITNGPSLKDFIKDNDQEIPNSLTVDEIPYLNDVDLTISPGKRKVLFETYGCQMNVNDTEIVWSILKNNNFLKTDNVKEADVILIMTCAIREGAESKIWHKLDYLRGLKKKRIRRPLKIGILGCMAERLKEKLIEKEKAVDLVAGPDSYKDLPRLLSLTENNQTAVNVLLSLDETYADIIPVRLNENLKSAFVSIMRGCDNMCTYCIVPFTRGRERSRDVDSILKEVKQLSDEGIKEVVLLGQNVNSYRDISNTGNGMETTKTAKGFRTVYKPKKGGLRFADLLDKVSLVDPEMRIRFTSPHPKDFPNEVLQIIKERPNICKSLHLPAQSGNSNVLERMRRGYTRENYLELIENVKSFLPGVALSSDFICGFCSETDEEFEDTITLMNIVKYNMCYMFAYSMREKTTAHRRFLDNVPSEIKQKRLLRMIEINKTNSEILNSAQIGEIQLILIEGSHKKTADVLYGKNDGNTKVLIPDIEILMSHDSDVTKKIDHGDYIAARIDSSHITKLKATPLFHTTLRGFNELSCKNDIKIKASVYFIVLFL